MRGWGSKGAASRGLALPVLWGPRLPCRACPLARALGVPMAWVPVCSAGPTCSCMVLGRAQPAPRLVFSGLGAGGRALCFLPSPGRDSPHSARCEPAARCA